MNWNVNANLHILDFFFYRNRHQSYPTIIEYVKRNLHALDFFDRTNLGLSHFMILRYLLSSLFSRSVPPKQAEYFLPALGEPPVKKRGQQIK